MTTAPTPESVQPAAPRWDMRVLVAFALIYIVWGSTFLAIRYAIESIPPFLMIGLRSAGAGLILYGIAVAARLPLPRRDEWPRLALIGFFYFVVCHGLLAWAEVRVPSGIAAVILALIPAWVVLLEAIRPGGKRPARLVTLGIVIGFAGLLVLLEPWNIQSGTALDVAAILVLAISALGWAVGTVLTRHTPSDASPIATSGMQLLLGGAMLLVSSLFTGAWGDWLSHPSDGRALLSLAYLIVIGSVVTFSAYVWLLRRVAPARVATYAYVNPVVAVLLGWLFAGERFTPTMMLGTAIVIIGVVLVITFQRSR